MMNINYVSGDKRWDECLCESQETVPKKNHRSIQSTGTSNSKLNK